MIEQMVDTVDVLVNTVINGDAKEELKKIPSESVNCIVTSPPYWALRDYGMDGQLGIEVSFQEYIVKLCDVFDEVRRVLRKDGTCWVNMGDTYGGTGDKRNCKDPKNIQGRNGQSVALNKLETAKSLCQIPSRFAIEMTNRGWILRNEIIWHKPNSMPTSAKDRFTVDFEKIFFFVKNRKYWFETQYEDSIWYKKDKRSQNGGFTKKGKSVTEGGKAYSINKSGSFNKVYGKRNKRAVFSVNTKPFLGDHFASYPEKLIEPLIEAGCPKDGIVLDPFFGAGTTGLVAAKQNKKYLGIELNPKYINIALERINNYKQISNRR